MVRSRAPNSTLLPIPQIIHNRRSRRARARAFVRIIESRRRSFSRVYSIECRKKKRKAEKISPGSRPLACARARVLSRLFYLNISPPVCALAFNSDELPFQGSLCPSFSRSPFAFPDSTVSLRCSHPLRRLSPSFQRAPATPCPFRSSL